MVECVGADVHGIVPGDRVVLSYPSCGTCPACCTGHNPYCEHSYALSFGGARLDGSTALTRPDGMPVHGHFFAHLPSLPMRSRMQQRGYPPYFGA